jgi:hypothetical protein
LFKIKKVIEVLFGDATKRAKEDFRHGELNPGLLGPSCVAKNTV